MKSRNVLAIALLSGCACTVATAQDTFQDVRVARPDYIKFRGVRYPVQAPAADDLQDIYNNTTGDYTGYGAVTPDWRRRTLDDITFTPGPGAGSGQIVTGLETGFIVDVAPPAGFEIVLGFWDLETIGGIPVHSMPLDAVVLGYAVSPAAGAWTTGLVDLTTLGFPLGGIQIPDDSMNLADWGAFQTGTTTLVDGVRFLMANNGLPPGAGPTVGNSEAGSYVDFDMNGSIDGTEFVAGTTYANGSNLYLRLQADVAPAVTGACCLPGGVCVTASPISCHTQNGVYQGDNTTCGTGCADQGACCLLDGSCFVTDEASCIGTFNGIFKGVSTVCGSDCPDVFTFTGGIINIPDGLPGGGCGIAAIADIVVPAGGNVSQVDVALNIPHTWQGDVKATLTHVDTGTQVVLIDQPGGGNFGADNYGLSPNGPDTFRLIDSAPFVYDGPQFQAIDNVRGQWKPEAALSAFAGEAKGGTWRLEVQDCFEADTGAIQGYMISFGAGSGPVACYANCDNSTQAPILNVADFTCFLQRFAAGESYANCDNSTLAPVLNVADFTCFLQSFAAGCP